MTENEIAETQRIRYGDPDLILTGELRDEFFVLGGRDENRDVNSTRRCGKRRSGDEVLVKVAPLLVWWARL